MQRKTCSIIKYSCNRKRLTVTSPPDGLIRDIGAYFDASLNVSTQVGRIISSSFYRLRRIHVILKSIVTSTAVPLFNGFVVPRVDYCNSLMAGSPACRLELVRSVQNGRGATYLRSTTEHCHEALAKECSVSAVCRCPKHRTASHHCTLLS